MKAEDKARLFFTKELFIETMNALQAQYSHDAECSKAAGIIFPDTHMGLYDNHRLTNQLIKLLQISFNDEHRDSWIEYYMRELDFGKKWSTDFTGRRADKSIINMSNAGELFDFLIED